jgi:hypothetical protein
MWMSDFLKLAKNGLVPHSSPSHNLQQSNLWLNCSNTFLRCMSTSLTQPIFVICDVARIWDQNPQCVRVLGGAQYELITVFNMAILPLQLFTGYQPVLITCEYLRVNNSRVLLGTLVALPSPKPSHLHHVPVSYCSISIYLSIYCNWDIIRS